MTVKELFANAGVENAGLVTEIESLLSIAESKNTGIPKSRFNEKVRECNELKADKVELENKVAELEGNIEKNNTEIERLKGVEVKFNEHRQKEDEKELAKWKEREKILTVTDADPTYDAMQRIINKFAIGEVTPEQARANNNLFDVYDDAQYFKTEDKNYPNGKKPQGGKAPTLNPFDLKNGVKGAFRDVAEAMRITRDDPVMAKKLMSEASDYKE